MYPEEVTTWRRIRIQPAASSPLQPSIATPCLHTYRHTTHIFSKSLIYFFSYITLFPQFKHPLMTSRDSEQYSLFVVLSAPYISSLFKKITCKTVKTVEVQLDFLIRFLPCCKCYMENSYITNYIVKNSPFLYYNNLIVVERFLTKVVTSMSLHKQPVVKVVFDCK